MNQEQNNFNVQNNNVINKPLNDNSNPSMGQTTLNLQLQQGQTYQQAVQQPLIYNQQNINNSPQEPKKKTGLILGIVVVLTFIALIVGILIFTKENSKESVNNDNNVVDKEDNENEEINDIISTEPKYKSDLLDSKHFSNDNFIPSGNSLGYDDVQGRIIDFSPGFLLTKQKLYGRNELELIWDTDYEVNGYTKIVRDNGVFWNVIKNDKNEYNVFYLDYTLKLNGEYIYVFGSNKDYITGDISIIKKEKDEYNIIFYSSEYVEHELTNLKKSEEKPLHLYNNGQILTENYWKIKDYIPISNFYVPAAIVVLQNNDAYIVNENFGLGYYNYGVKLASEKIINIDTFFETTSNSLLTYSEIDVIDKIFINNYMSENNKYILTEKQSILLPNNYTTKDIKNIDAYTDEYNNKLKIIIEFYDNCVYILTENKSFELIEELSNLNKENHLVKIGMSTHYYVVLMDDGYLYKINK